MHQHKEGQAYESIETCTETNQIESHVCPNVHETQKEIVTSTAINTSYTQQHTRTRRMPPSSQLATCAAKPEEGEELHICSLQTDCRPASALGRPFRKGRVLQAVPPSALREPTPLGEPQAGVGGGEEGHRLRSVLCGRPLTSCLAGRARGLRQQASSLPSRHPAPALGARMQEHPGPGRYRSWRIY